MGHNFLSNLSVPQCIPVVCSKAAAMEIDKNVSVTTANDNSYFTNFWTESKKCHNNVSVQTSNFVSWQIFTVRLCPGRSYGRDVNS